MTVTCASPRDRVRHFVEQHLVDVVITGQLCQVSGNSDAFFVMVAGAKPSLCVVEGETPRLI
jgi:hypothetical protein